MKIDLSVLDSILMLYQTNVETGLSSSEAEKRLKQNGLNVLPEEEQETWVQVFIDQFRSPLIYMLVSAAVIIFFVGEDKLDAFIILGVLFFNAIVGTIQEGKTQSILHSLKKLIKTTTIVIRDGRKQLVDDSLLTIGDIILLQEGQRIPADAYVVDSSQLQVDESMLTGESRPVYKYAYTTAEKEGSSYKLYKGTYLMSGSGKAVIVAVGAESSIGKINLKLEELNTEMPLKKEIDRLSYWLLFMILGICLFLFVMGLLVGQPLKELFVMLTALFICVVPEGLPVVMTLVLAAGVYRMSKEKLLVKRMQAVEGLGRADVILMDKTGTLTRNELMVHKIFCNKLYYELSGEGYHKEGALFLHGVQVEAITCEHPLYQLEVASVLLNSSELTYEACSNTFDLKGNPTETAMYVAAQKLGVDVEQVAKEYKKLYEIPFDAQLQYHAGFFDCNGQGTVFLVGAPELLLRISHSDQDYYDAHERMLQEGLRVVAVASKHFDATVFKSEFSTKAKLDIAKNVVDAGMFHFNALVGIQDSIRQEAAPMIKQVEQAGLRVIMATGDHKGTALHVAQEVGIFKKNDKVLTGAQMRELSDEQILHSLDSISVFARLMPDEKMRLISLLHRQGKIVAMTGDGINDAPALLAADLGIAMGGNKGTEVAKRAANIVLLTDSFANIVYAIEEGRHIFYTLKRVILYFFATNMAEVLIVLFALLLNLIGMQFPLPLTAAQILWLNLVTDGFLDVSLAMEPKEKGILDKNWLKKGDHLIDLHVLLKIFFYAIPMAVGSLMVFIYYHRYDLALARTMTLVSMAMFQWFNAWNARSSTKSLFAIGFLSNRWLLISASIVILLQLLLIYAPFMHYIFKTVPLSLMQLIFIVMFTSSIVLCDEVRKFFLRNRKE